MRSSRATAIAREDVASEEDNGELDPDFLSGDESDMADQTVVAESVDGAQDALALTLRWTTAMTWVWRVRRELIEIRMSRPYDAPSYLYANAPVEGDKQNISPCESGW